MSGFETFSYQAADGLTLSGRDYGDREATALPVVCLPGLTRTARDFDLLARSLADGIPARRVLAFDYRGRGLSAWDPSGESYNPLVEMQDVLLGMASRGIKRAVLVGTSRGGIITMLMSATSPDTIAGAVLNDIGSVIENAGLLRIKSYVGQGVAPQDWTEAALAVKATQGRYFPAYSDQDWLTQARLTFGERDGKPVVDNDPLLARGLATVTAETPSVDLSPAFATLAGKPVMVIRGMETDLLSSETLAAMQAAHPGLVAVEVPGEGHPPMLRGALLDRITEFVNGIG